MNGQLLKVAVIGNGMIANVAHIPAWKHLTDDVEVVAVADPRDEVAEETARRYGIPKSYKDPQKMLNEVKPDIVSVCTPNVYHREWTLAALKAGANVLCEKPITTSYVGAKEMFDTARAGGRLLYVSQTSRFTTDYMAAKEVAKSGRLGRIYYGEIAAIRRRGIPMWGFFHMKEHNAGGPLYDLGVHIIDALFWMMDNPAVASVSGATYLELGNKNENLATSLADSGAPAGTFRPRTYDWHEFNVEDLATGYIRMQDGATILFRTSWAVNMPENYAVYLAGTQAGLALPGPKIIENDGRYMAEIALKVQPNQNVNFPGHWRVVENFVGVLKGKEEQVVKEAEVLNVIRTIEALYRSAEEKREIRIGE